jgi:hypothetical protein
MSDDECTIIGGVIGASARTIPSTTESKSAICTIANTTESASGSVSWGQLDEHGTKLAIGVEEVD